MKVHQSLRTCITTVHGSGVAETTKLHNSNIAHFYSTYISVSAYILYITLTYIYICIPSATLLILWHRKKVPDGLTLTLPICAFHQTTANAR